jgi:protein phosphatase
MSTFPHQIYCPNLTCTAPLNDFGSRLCDNCQTPLVYRYLWAVGQPVLQASVGSQIGGRYHIVAPQVWLDTQPSLLPEFPEADLPDEMLPYLYLYPQRLHVPEVHGICPKSEEFDTTGILLLENAPLNEQGLLHPAIAQVWEQATATRQLYWLWQLLQLWEPLIAQGVGTSLLIADNIRVEGWRVRLCQLFLDESVLFDPEQEEQFVALSLADLAAVWLGWVDQAKPTIIEPLQELCALMRIESTTVQAIAAQLNHLLLEQAAQLPLRLQVVGHTDAGSRQEHNEDTCYPLTLQTKIDSDGIFPQLAVVCDGIGGHEGGEVASQMAVQSLNLQIQALLAEVSQSTDLFSPEVVVEQLEAIVRVINDLIASQNDAQGREARRRMGTTLVAALQLPQQISFNREMTTSALNTDTMNGTTTETTVSKNSHELYLINIGDSRAYWITPRYCHCLTVDDDVATREVRMGRLLYQEALQRPDAGALIQALGTRDSEFLRPSVQRFIVEEDGILLLCSDGLSDNGLIEEAWAMLTGDLFRGKRSLDDTVQAWIELANQKNGHDNVSVVLMQCHVSSPLPDISLPPAPSLEQTTSSDWAASSRGLLPEAASPSTELQTDSATSKKHSLPWRRILLGVLGVVVLSGIGLTIWAQINPRAFQEFQERLSPASQQTKS